MSVALKTEVNSPDYDYAFNCICRTDQHHPYNHADFVGSDFLIGISRNSPLSRTRSSPQDP